MKKGLKLSVRILFLVLIFSTFIACQSDENETPNEEGSKVDAPPVFTSGKSISVIENTTTTGHLATAEVADGGTIIYSLSGGEDKDKFTINPSSGELDFLAAPDFQAPTDSDSNNTYIVEITASDGALSVTQSVTVTVVEETTVSEELPPIFTSAISVNVTNKTKSGVYKAEVTDVNGDSITFGISGGADQDDFTINSSSGLLDFIISPNFQFPSDKDQNNVYEVEISASDGIHTIKQNVSLIIINPTQSAPVFVSPTQISVIEKTENTGYIAEVEDANGDPILFSISGGADQNLFIIDPTSGSLRFKTKPDYIRNLTYKIDIAANDGFNTVIQSVTVIVLEDKQYPPFFITNGRSVSVIDFAENSTEAVYIARAYDVNGDTVTFSLKEESDHDKFNIDPVSGVLRFIDAPDYENPIDTKLSNYYMIGIIASDGAKSSRHSVRIRVSNTNDSAPIFISNSTVNIGDNTTTTGYTAATTDADSRIAKVRFNISGGPDKNQFQMNAKSGQLNFIVEPNYHFPTDSDADNIYVVEITANDDLHTAIQTVKIEVSDVLQVTASSSDDSKIRFDWETYGDATNYKLLINIDGNSGFELLKVNIIGTNTKIELPAHLTNWINATYLLEAHDDNGKLTESLPISITSLMVSNIGYFKASNTDAGDFFGHSISLSSDGSTMAIGAKYEDSNARSISNDGSGESDNSSESSGAVYIFNRDKGNWIQQAYLKPQEAFIKLTNGHYTHFGSSVSLSENGNTVAIGAPWDDSNAIGINQEGSTEYKDRVDKSGAAYVFVRDGSVWTQQAYIKASNRGLQDEFGNAVSISADGNTLAVGAPGEASNATGVSYDGTGETNNSASNSGAVYVYVRSADMWNQQAYIKASNSGSSLGTGFNDHGDLFGKSISLSEDGNTLAIAALGEESGATEISSDGTGEDDNSAPNSGAVYVFNRNEAIWEQRAYIKASNSRKNDLFGTSISLAGDGKTLVVGAPSEDSKLVGINYVQPTVNDRHDIGRGRGAVYIFTNSGVEWIQQVYINVGASSSGFGYAVSISGDGKTLAVGTPFENSSAVGVIGNNSYIRDDLASNSGIVYMFKRSSNITWNQQTRIKASNPGENDYFGHTLSLTADGNSLAVGSPQEDSNAIGFSNNSSGSNDNSSENSGAVYLY